MTSQIGIDELAEKFREQRDEVEKTLCGLRALRDRKVAYFIRSSALFIISGMGGGHICDEALGNSLMDRLCQFTHMVRSFDRELLHSFTSSSLDQQNEVKYAWPGEAPEIGREFFDVRGQALQGIHALKGIRDDQVRKVFAETVEAITGLVDISDISDLRNELSALIERVRAIDADVLATTTGDEVSFRTASNYFYWEE